MWGIVVLFLAFLHRRDADKSTERPSIKFQNSSYFSLSNVIAMQVLLRSVLFLFILATASGQTFAQLSDTLYFDRDWVRCSKEYAAFYSFESLDSVGVGQCFYITGELQSIDTYVHGVRHGHTVWYYRNGQKSAEVEYVNQLEEGIYRSWYECGAKKNEFTYSKGLRHGPSISWRENGSVEEEGAFKNDGQDGVWTYWDSDGKKGAEIEHWYNQRHGYAVWFYPNGNKKIECNYQHGELHGLLIHWYQNGQKQSEVEYSYGRDVGGGGYWDRTGHQIYSEWNVTTPPLWHDAESLSESMKILCSYMSGNTVLPVIFSIARHNQGKPNKMEFIIDETGTITEVVFRDGLHHAMEDEIRRMFVGLGGWDPAIVGMQYVRFRHEVPLSIQLKE